MDELISRQDALDALKEYEIVESDNFTKTDLITMMTVGTIANCIEAIVDLPSAEPNLIHCADCRWWKQDEDIAPYGWCFACKSGSYTEHWDISIRRKYKGDFFCADAEPRIEGEDDDE